MSVIIFFRFSILGQCFDLELEVHLVGTKYLTGFAAIDRSYDAGLLELVHDAACTVVTDGELALDE